MVACVSKVIARALLHMGAHLYAFAPDQPSQPGLAWLALVACPLAGRPGPASPARANNFSSIFSNNFVSNFSNNFLSNFTNNFLNNFTKSFFDFRQ